MLFLDFIKILEWLMISVGIMVIPPPQALDLDQGWNR